MSDFPESPQNAYVSPQVVEKQGMSSGTKVLLILGILFLVCILLCCGGGIFFTYVASSYMKDAFTDDPVKIEQRRAEMLEIDIPDSFRPEVSIDMTVPMTDQRFMTIVAYRGESPGDSIVLVGIGDMLMGTSEEEMRRQIEQSLQQQGIGSQQSVGDWEVEKKEFTVAGKPAEFVFRTNKNKEGEPQQFQVTGMVTGKRGPVMVTISADAKKLSEEQIDQMIESIQ